MEMEPRNFQLELFTRLQEIRQKRSAVMARIEATKRLAQPISDKDRTELYDYNIRIEELERLISVP